MKEIIIFCDDRQEMLKIEKNGKKVFEGNTWDIERSAEGLQELFKKIGVIAKIKKYQF